MMRQGDPGHGAHANLAAPEPDAAGLAGAPADPAFTQGPFTGAAACAMCHDGIVDAAGRSVSIFSAWSSTMMANAARDPFWKAKLESEQTRNPEHTSIVNETCTRCHAPMAHVLSQRDGAELAMKHGGIDETSPYYSTSLPLSTSGARCCLSTPRMPCITDGRPSDVNKCLNTAMATLTARLVALGACVVERHITLDRAIVDNRVRVRPVPSRSLDTLTRRSSYVRIY